VRSGLTDLRRAVKAIKPAVLETLTLTEALKALIYDFQSKHSLQISCQVTGAQYSLPQTHALLLYHAASEALTNVLRHAPDAPSVDVHLSFNQSYVRLMVSNAASNEINTNSSSDNLLQGSGTGLRSLADRAHNLAGHFMADAQADGGFVVEIELPVI